MSVFLLFIFKSFKGSFSCFNVFDVLTEIRTMDQIFIARDFAMSISNFFFFFFYLFKVDRSL